ncbi:cytochrome P450 family protein [Streptomyces sp. 7N604]|uniref:cytochrome P450 family protein n=1 Tax=Streptomyces sp. 7N604 TaxID=3457415 RepID=UPI003FD1587C
MNATPTEPLSLVINPDYLRDPHTVHARLRASGSAYPLLLPNGTRAWVVTRYGDVRAALTDPRLAKDAVQVREIIARQLAETGQRVQMSHLFPRHMLNGDPPDHSRLRRLVAKPFTQRRIQQLRPRVLEITEDLLDAMPTDRPADLIGSFAFQLPITVICELLGVPLERQADFRRWTGTLLGGGHLAAVEKAARELNGYMAELIAAKRARPADDLLSSLVHVDEAGDQLTEEELLGTAVLLLIAGHETTVNLIGNGVLALLCAPDQWELLRGDMTLLPQAVEELLRYGSPVRLATYRYTTEPVRIGDTVIPEGELVLLGLGSANRDPDQFDEPHLLDVSRSAGGHLALGHGIHYCLGAPLARLEGEVAIGRLIERFPRTRLAASPEQLRWRESVIMQGMEELPVYLRP